MTEDSAVPVEKNFRSSYYKSLGFRQDEKNLTQLEGIIKADTIDLTELKAFCLKYTLASCYRSTVWKVLTGVAPVHTDEDTSSFVREQKQQQYRDLKHALQVMGRIESPSTSISSSSSAALRRRTLAGDQSLLARNATPPSSQASLTTASQLPQPSHISLSQSHLTTTVGQQSSSLKAYSPDSREGTRKSYLSVIMDGPVSSRCSVLPEHIVLMYLLENNRLLLSSVNQMKLEAQVNLSSIARVMLHLFDFEESESDIYWLFSGFAKQWEMKLSNIDKLRASVCSYLREADLGLYSHLKDMNALEDGIPYDKWFGRCFASDLSESALKTVWDRVMAGSSVVVVFVAVAILLSARKQLLSLRMVRDIRQHLNSICRDNLPLIVNQALEMWESTGSPLEPR